MGMETHDSKSLQILLAKTDSVKDLLSVVGSKQVEADTSIFFLCSRCWNLLFPSVCSSQPRFCHWNNDELIPWLFKSKRMPPILSISK